MVPGITGTSFVEALVREHRGKAIGIVALLVLVGCWVRHSPAPLQRPQSPPIVITVLPESVPPKVIPPAKVLEKVIPLRIDVPTVNVAPPNKPMEPHPPAQPNPALNPPGATASATPGLGGLPSESGDGGIGGTDQGSGPPGSPGIRIGPDRNKAFDRTLAALIQEALARDPRLHGANFTVKMLLFPLRDGGFRAELRDSTGTPDLDETIRLALSQLLPGLPAPPTLAPRLIRMSSRS